MKKIDIKKIVSDLNLDRKELSDKLFPMHKYPTMALDRLLRGEMLLDSLQIGKLSVFTGIPIEELFTPSWESVVRGKLVLLVSGDNRAELDTHTWETKLFKKSVAVKTLKIHTPQMALSEYISRLDFEFSKIK